MYLLLSKVLIGVVLQTFLLNTRKYKIKKKLISYTPTLWHGCFKVRSRIESFLLFCIKYIKPLSFFFCCNLFIHSFLYKIYFISMKEFISILVKRLELFFVLVFFIFFFLNEAKSLKYYSLVQKVLEHVLGKYRI